MFDLSNLSKYRAEIYGFCALWIVFYHSTLCEVDWSFGNSNLLALDSFIRSGDLGVDAFLLLSGMSLYFTWQKNTDIDTFFRRRVTRLLPSFFVIYGGALLVEFFAQSISWTSVLFSLSLIPKLFITGSQGIWYVPAILLFYISFPYLYSFIYGKEKRSEFKIANRTLLLIALALFWFWMFHKYSASMFAAMNIFLGRAPAFIVGIYIGHFVFEKRKMPAGIVFFIVLAFVGFCYIFNPLGDFSWSTWWWRLLYPVGGVLIAVVLSWLFYALAKFSVWCKTGGRFLRYTGTISLELYIAHICIYWTGGLLPSIDGNVWLMLVYAAAAFALSAFVSKLIDVVPGWVRTSREALLVNR